MAVQALSVTIFFCYSMSCDTQTKIELIYQSLTTICQAEIDDVYYWILLPQYLNFNQSSTKRTSNFVLKRSFVGIIHSGILQRPNLLYKIT